MIFITAIIFALKRKNTKDTQKSVVTLAYISLNGDSYFYKNKMYYFQIQFVLLDKYIRVKRNKGINVI